MLQKNNTFFDKIAIKYNELVFGAHVPNEIQKFLGEEYNLILKEVNNLNKVRLIDFGCGTGFYLKKLSPYIQYGLGVDISEEMVYVARTNLQGLKNVRIKHADVRRLPPWCKHERFNLGICTYNTLGTTQDWHTILREAIDQMREGVLFLSIFAGERFARFARKVYSSWADYVGPIENNVFDNDNKIFKNTATGFTSHWLTWEELYPAVKDLSVKRRMLDLGHFLRIEVQER